MAKFVGTHPWDSIERDLSKPGRRPVIAVVAYIGADGPELLHLRRGDALVCEASEALVGRGVTNAEALRRLRRRGITIFSVQGLHAKVIASRSFAWVGSANASRTSTRLIEASVRLSRADAVAVYEWAESLCTEDVELTPAEIGRLCEIPVKTGPGPLLPESTRTTLPDNLPSLTVCWLNRGVAARQYDAAQRERPFARSAFPAQAGRLDVIAWDDALPSGIAPGKWILSLTEGRPDRPGVVVRVSDHGSFKLVWTRTATTARRPSQAAFAEAMGAAWSGWDEALDATCLIRGSARTAKLLGLYREV